MSDSAAAPVGEIVGIQAQATARTGRFIISAGSNHFISDAKPNAGGPGEAVAAGQLLLASLASCGLGLIQ
ncbi:MAG: OsmC family peroxiredoxin, partial [Comamonadaceae bacterium]